MRRAFLTLATVLLLLTAAGCGGSDDKEGSAKSPTPAESAEKFIGCFKHPGYQAVHPKEGEASLFALQAEKHGYDVVPVNVAKPGPLGSAAFLVFFKDASTAKKALDDLGVINPGDAKPLVRGQTIVGYLDDETKRELEPAIGDCL